MQILRNTHSWPPSNRFGSDASSSEMWVADGRQIHYSLMAAVGGPWQAAALVSQELPDVLLRVTVRCPSGCLHWVLQSANFFMDETTGPAEASLNSGPPALPTMYEMSDHSKSWSQFYYSFIKPRLRKVWAILFQPHVSASWITDPAHKPAQWHEEPLRCQQCP